MNNDMPFFRQDIGFYSENNLLRGWLYMPESQQSKYPIIIMAHGYGCVKELYLDNFAEVFAKAGFMVLVYDQPNFGESEGMPRQEIDPWLQVRAYRDAITYAETLSQVDTDKIGIWGTSYSGGHVLVVAATDKRVRCVVSQVPTISGYRNSLRRIAPSQWPAQRKAWADDRRARYAGTKPVMVPILPNTDALKGVITSEEAWELFKGDGSPAEVQRRVRWRNEVTLRSTELYAEYEPGSYIGRIAPTPLLMVLADQDDVTMTDEELTAYNQANEPKQLVMIKGSHFSPYIRQFEPASRAACQWFQQYLLTN